MRCRNVYIRTLDYYRPGSLRSWRIKGEGEGGGGGGKSGEKKERAEGDWGEGGSACNKSPYWFNSAVAGGRKIPIGQSDNRVASWCDNRGSIKMATEVDVLSKALADLNVAATREFTLKPEQEVVVRGLLHGKDVLAVLPTGYGI